MIERLFPTPIWNSKINLEDNERLLLMKSIKNNYEKYEDYTHPEWNCKVHSTMSQHNNIDYSVLGSHILNEYEKFASQMKLKDHQYLISNIWYNYYIEGSNQESHTHTYYDVDNKKVTFFSGVYFLEIDSSHPKLFFENPTTFDSFCSLFHLENKIFNKDNNDHSLNYSYLNYGEKDQILIFPSFIKHGVFLQKTKKPRITIGFNIDIAF